MSLRVINLGLPKSGTTTLARALKLAGWKVADHRIRARQTDDAELQGAFVADLLYQGYFGDGDPAAAFTGFDAISECSVLQKDRSVWPQTDPALIRALRDQIPDLKFLATRRAAEEISRSMLAWFDLGSARLPHAVVPGLPAGFGSSDSERVRWIDGHYRTLATLFQRDPNFLELDVASDDARAQLSDFLGLDLPWWGKANANPRRTVEARRG